ncbi:MAG: hypothetical protein ACREEC_11630, partial [Thermoplasmata archaeon]
HFLATTGRGVVEERRRLASEIVELVRERVGRELSHRLERDPELRRLLDQVVARSIDPRSAAARLERGRPAAR